ncbi:MAG: hypothetical protein ACK51L_00750 [bacterium]
MTKKAKTPTEHKQEQKQNKSGIKQLKGKHCIIINAMNRHYLLDIPHLKTAKSPNVTIPDSILIHIHEQSWCCQSMMADQDATQERNLILFHH